MSEFRREEIKRTLNQMRDTLTFVRTMSHDGAPKVTPEMAAMHGTAFAAAFIDLVGGMAADLNEINERLEAQSKPVIAEAFGLDDPDKL